MTRWFEICTLVSDGEPTQTESGSWTIGEQEETVVFCNPYTVGLDTWLVSNRDLGLKADAEIQVRACDYTGQPTVLYRDNEYTVEKVTDSGEFIRLQLGRKAKNV